MQRIDQVTPLGEQRPILPRLPRAEPLRLLTPSGARREPDLFVEPPSVEPPTPFETFSPKALELVREREEEIIALQQKEQRKKIFGEAKKTPTKEIFRRGTAATGIIGLQILGLPKKALESLGKKIFGEGLGEKES